MSMNQKRHDPFQPIRHFYELVETKCDELPSDISHWKEMASQHEEESKTHKNIIQSSVKPREAFLIELKQVKNQMQKALDVIDSEKGVKLPEINLDMPFETIMRKYSEFTQELSSVAENSQSFAFFFKDLMSRILFIRTDLSQTILRCSTGEINLKEVEHQLKVLEPELETIMEEDILEKKGYLSTFTEQLIQKVELDVSVRQAIQDRHVMHSTLQTYLKQVDSNTDFKKLLPTIQFKIKQIISRPLDNILSEQQHEVDIAKHELVHLIEPVGGQTAINVPDSVSSVHQLLQQAVNKTEEMNRLKVNVMGAFKHLVTQMDQLFQSQPLPPVQAASVLGAAWMQHPLTSPESIRDFKGQLDVIKKSDSYIKLSQYMGESRVDESFRYIDLKMNEMAEQLEMNERVESMKVEEDLPVLVNATDVSVQTNAIDPFKVRKEIMARMGYLSTIKTYIKQLSDSIKAHLLLVYYEHSLNPEKVNLKLRTNAVLNQISAEFYDRKNTDESIDKHVFMNAVKAVFDEICDVEMEKNIQIFELRNQIKSLFKTLRQTNPMARKTVRKKLINQRKELKLKLIEINAPRLKLFVDTLSESTYENIHLESLEKVEDLKEKLRRLVQQKLAMEQMQVL